MALGGFLAVVALARIVSKAPGDPFGNLVGFGGGLFFAGVGGFVVWLASRAGTARLRVDPDGWHFASPQGVVRTVRWSNPRFVGYVYDVSRVPPGSSYGRMDPIWRYAVILDAPFRVLCRTPRDGYDAVLAEARANAMVVEPWSTFFFRSGEDAVAFRIRRPK